MTIKQRLFLSNILMIIIPVILSLAIASVVMYVFTEEAGYHDRGKPPVKNEKIFNDSIKTTKSFAKEWSQDVSLDRIMEDVERFNHKYLKSGISLAIYNEKELIYPSSALINSQILDLLSQEGSHPYSTDDITVYRQNAGDYSIILTSQNKVDNTKERSEDHHGSLIDLGILMFLLIIGIILLTNSFLTRFVFKSIIVPLETLVYGVHEIRDGNLDYRITYTGKDEFSGVCSDFNEMAQRLLDSVEARQKDEANRKELIAGISHDLRTPLTSIKAYAEGIEKGVASTSESKKRYLETIKNKAKEIEQIVNKLFLFSKLDIGEFPFYLERVNIGQEISSLVDLIRAEYEKKGLNIIIVENIDAYVEVDVVQLRNAVTNVLENSVKYRDKEQGQMKISLQKDKEYVTIKLGDNGPGVPKESIEKLFDIFYRSDPSRSNTCKGSGLGLAITAKIIERFGGSIKAENVYGSGLSIIMFIPLDTGGIQIEKDSNR